MNKDNLLIVAVAALAVFGVYKMTRTTVAATKPATAINNTATGIYPGWGGSLDLGLAPGADPWKFNMTSDLVNALYPVGQSIQLATSYGS